MELRKASGDCDDDDCPAVYVSDRGTAVVQGDLVHEAHGLSLAPAEAAVEVPPAILIEAIGALTGDPKFRRT